MATTTTGRSVMDKKGGKTAMMMVALMMVVVVATADPEYGAPAYTRVSRTDAGEYARWGGGGEAHRGTGGVASSFAGMYRNFEHSQAPRGPMGQPTGWVRGQEPVKAKAVSQAPSALEVIKAYQLKRDSASGKNVFSRELYHDGNDVLRMYLLPVHEALQVWTNNPRYHNVLHRYVSTASATVVTYNTNISNAGPHTPFEFKALGFNLPKWETVQHIVPLTPWMTIFASPIESNDIPPPGTYDLTNVPYVLLGLTGPRPTTTDKREAPKRLVSFVKQSLQRWHPELGNWLLPPPSPQRR